MREQREKVEDLIYLAESTKSTYLRKQHQTARSAKKCLSFYGKAFFFASLHKIEEIY